MVCPIGGGSPTPAPASECVFPLDPKRGEEVVKVPMIRRLDRKPGTLHTMCFFSFVPESVLIFLY